MYSPLLLFSGNADDRERTSGRRRADNGRAYPNSRRATRGTGAGHDRDSPRAHQGRETAFSGELAKSHAKSATAPATQERV
jgi:hypothetical protein